MPAKAKKTTSIRRNSEPYTTRRQAAADGLKLTWGKELGGAWIHHHVGDDSDDEEEVGGPAAQNIIPVQPEEVPLVNAIENQVEGQVADPLVQNEEAVDQVIAPVLEDPIEQEDLARVGMDEIGEDPLVRAQAFETGRIEVEDAIDFFTPDDVFESELGAADTELANVKAMFLDFRRKARAFMGELDVNNAAQLAIKNDWEPKIEELTTKFKTNDRVVRTKVDELKRRVAEKTRTETAAAATVASASADEKEKRLVKARSEIDRKDILQDIQDLQIDVGRAANVKDLSDQEVVKFIKTSSTWVTSLNSIRKKTTDLQKMTVVHEMNPRDKTELDDKVAEIKAAVEGTVRNLEDQDSNRNLYTNTGTKSKEPVTYPIFKGKDGEDVNKFIRDFKEALVRNQVATVDQAKILRNHLKNFALDIVSKDATEIKPMYDALTKQFGSVEVIWQQKYKLFMAECDKNWPSLRNSPKERFQKLGKLLYQFEDLEKLFSEGVNKAELYNTASVNKLFGVLPTDVMEEVVKMMEDEATPEGQIETLKKVLTKFKSLAQRTMLLQLPEKEKPEDVGKPEGFNAQGKKNVCFYCGEDWSTESHIKDWGIFGCPSLLNSTVEERIEKLKRKKMCFTCGFLRVTKPDQDPKAHKCHKKFAELKCQGEYNGKDCSWNGLMCPHRKVQQSVKDKIMTKFSISLSGYPVIFGDLKAPAISSGESAAVQSGGSKTVLFGDSKAPAVSPDESAAVQSGGSKIPTANLGESAAVRMNNDIFDKKIEELQAGEIAKAMDNIELLEYYRQVEERQGRDPNKVLGVPEGEPVFIFCPIKGKINTLRSFLDGGCSSWLAKEGVPQKELTSVKLREGPIPIWVAGGHSVNANAEWSSLLPLRDGTGQAVRGLSIDEVTGPCGDINVAKVMNELREQARIHGGPGSEQVSKLTAPDWIKGGTDMLIGIKYNKIFPKPIYMAPNGLTLFETKFYTGGKSIACVGGPSMALAALANQVGPQVTQMFMSMTEAGRNYAPRLDFFPELARSSDEVIMVNVDPELLVKEEELLVELIETEEMSETVEDQACLCHKFLCHNLNTDLREYLDLDGIGLKMDYKCPRCRDCINCRQGEKYERTSIKQEREHCMIRESIWIDEDKGRAVAKLPFRVNPNLVLTNNFGSSLAMLQKVCIKYSKDPAVVASIVKAINKLLDNQHFQFWRDLTDEERDIINKAPVHYFIPWDVAFSDSISTPARPVFNASKNSPGGGTNLNDTIVKGIANLVSLVQLVLNWHGGPEAIAGDITQFYNAVLLFPQHIPFQQFLYKENLNPDGEVLRGVIKTLIYGVRSVAAQTEVLIGMIADKILEEYPEVARFLLKFRYVDDMAKGVLNREEGGKLIEETNKVLEMFKLKVKGWVISGEKPPEQLILDGETVGFAGFAWRVKCDVYNLNHSPLHFESKIRGKLPDSVVYYDPETMDIQKFVPKNLSRRRVTSRFMARWDIMGKEVPLTMKFKWDLRELIKVSPDWDAPIPEEMRQIWIFNFKMMHETRDFWFKRSVVPVDAVNPRAMRLWVLYDAAEKGGIIVGIWAGYELKDGNYSCAHLIGKGLLANDKLSTPKLEMHALSVAANLTMMVMEAVEEWLGQVHLAGDSEIAICWLLYETNKLDVFVRNRANNVRAKVSLDQVHWVQGEQNLADVGTRPQDVNAQTVHPLGEYHTGKDWMKLPYDKALESGIVRKATDIKLGHDNKKIFKEGLLVEEDFEKEIKGFIVKVSKPTPQKIVECENDSNYPYSPLKYGFRRTVRVYAMVLRFVARLKRNVARKRERNALLELDEKCEHKYFPVGEEKPEKRVKVYFHVEGCVARPDDKAALTVTKKIYCLLEDIDLSRALAFLYGKGTEEVKKYVRSGLVEKISVEKEGILYYKGRILDQQVLKVVGGIEDVVDVDNLVGFNFKVPILYRFSPLAITIANHLHYEVLKHKGVESCFRLALNHVHIIEGRVLFQDICDDCVKCKKLRKKYIEVEMGGVHDSQVNVSPIFYSTVLDVWGPLRTYCPGYERATRQGSKEYKGYALVMACLATGSINIQFIEGIDTGGVMSGLNRFFAETTQVPKLMFPDKQSSLIKAMKEMEGCVRDLQYQLSEQRGVHFEPCLPQGHSAHGRIERVIRSLQESLEAAEVRTERLTATAWATVLKGIESAYNALPLGSYYRRCRENVSVLRILTPNLLMGRISNRAPSGLFEVPSDSSKLTEKIGKVFEAWYQLWNTIYVPQIIASHQKWFKTGEALKEDDLVLFKLRESELSVVWVMGRVDHVKRGRDGLSRECLISYQNLGKTDEVLTVERPVREVVKLMGIDEMGLLDEIAKARDLAKSVLKQKDLYHEEKFDLVNATIQGGCVFQGSVQFSSATPLLQDFHQQVEKLNGNVGEFLGDNTVIESYIQKLGNSEQLVIYQ